MATYVERNGTYTIQVSDGFDSRGNRVRKSMTWKPDPGMSQKAINRELAKRITQTPGCCLVTQFPDGTAPMAVNFLSRNAVMATMADLVIVVESKVKGGAILTAKYAYDQGVPVLAVPGRVDDVRSSGCNALISSGIATMLSSITKLETINLSQDA